MDRGEYSTLDPRAPLEADDQLIIRPANQQEELFLSRADAIYELPIPSGGKLCFEDEDTCIYQDPATEPSSDILSIDVGGKNVLNIKDTLELNSLTLAEQTALTGIVRGSIHYQTDNNAFIGNFSTSVTPDSGTWGPVAEFPSFAFGLETTPRDTTFVAGNTPVEAISTMVPAPSNILWTLTNVTNFSRWTYDGPDKITSLSSIRSQFKYK